MIIQPTLEVPAKVAAGLASGKFVLVGGVVRHAQNQQIVALLKDAPPVVANEGTLARAAALVRSHPGKSAAVAIGVAAVVGTVTVLAAKRHGNNTQQDSSEAALDALAVSLRAYLDAAERGRLDQAVISRLLKDVENVSRHIGETATAVDVHGELWEDVVRLIVDHTHRLAEAYGVTVDEQPDSSPAPPEGSIGQLQRHLRLQRQILDDAA